MSILIILPFSAPFFLLDVDQPAEELSATINAELWNMPADFLAWLLAQGITPAPPASWQAFTAIWSSSHRRLRWKNSSKPASARNTIPNPPSA